MNILFITCWYPTTSNPNSGIFIKEHAKAIHLAGAKIRVVHVNTEYSNAWFNHSIEKFTDVEGIPVLRINLKSRIWKLFYLSNELLFFFLKKSIINHLADFNPTLVHSNVIYQAGILGDKMAQHLDAPHVISEHWSNMERFFRINLYANRAKKAFKRAYCIMPVSHFLKGKIARYAANHKNIKVVGNAVDNTLFQYTPKKKQQDKLKFLAIASWHQTKRVVKRPDLILESLEIVNKSIDKQITLEFIGDGNLIPSLKKKAEKCSFSVTFSGKRDKSYVSNAMKKTDFFLHASMIETFSIVIAEALMTGTPVIASKVGGVPELINETNGLLTKNNVDDWVNAIIKALHTDFNHSSIAAEITHRFSHKTTGRQFMEVYQSMIDERIQA